MTLRIAVPLVAGALALAGAVLAAPSPPQLTVPCDEIAGPSPSGDADGYRVVLDVISVPPAYLGQVVRVRGEGRWRYWSKVGLVVNSRAGPVVVSVPVAWRRRVAITWGNRSGYFHTLRIAACPSVLAPDGWHGYAGGFLLRARSACVPLVFRTGGRSATVRFGIGRHCTTQ
jgi:hypothetical protein